MTRPTTCFASRSSRASAGADAGALPKPTPPAFESWDRVRPVREPASVPGRGGGGGGEGWGSGRVCGGGGGWEEEREENGRKRDTSSGDQHLHSFASIATRHPPFVIR